MPPAKTNDQSNRFHPYQQPPTSHSDDDDGTTANTGDVVIVPANSPDLGTLRQTCKRCLISGETAVLCHADHLESLFMCSYANTTGSQSISLSHSDSTPMIVDDGGSASGSNGSNSMSNGSNSMTTGGGNVSMFKFPISVVVSGGGNVSVSNGSNSTSNGSNSMVVSGGGNVSMSNGLNSMTIRNGTISMSNGSNSMVVSGGGNVSMSNGPNSMTIRNGTISMSNGSNSMVVSGGGNVSMSNGPNSMTIRNGTISMSNGSNSMTVGGGGGSVPVYNESTSVTINGGVEYHSMSFTSSSNSSATESVGYIRFTSNGNETVIKHDCKGQILKKVVNGVEKRLLPRPAPGNNANAPHPTTGLPAVGNTADGQPQATEPVSFDTDAEPSSQVHGQEPSGNESTTPDDEVDDDDDDFGYSDYDDDDDGEEDELTPGVHQVHDADDPSQFYDDGGDETGNARNRVPSRPRPKCGPKSKRGKGKTKRKAKSKSKRKPSTASKKKPCSTAGGTAPTDGGDGAANAAAAETVGDVEMAESSSTEPSVKVCKKKTAGGGSSDEPPAKKRKVLKCACNDGATDGAGSAVGEQSENGQVEQLADSVAVPCGSKAEPKKKKKKGGRSKSTCRGKSKSKPARKKPPKPKKSAGKACPAGGETDAGAESGDAGAAVAAAAAGDNSVNPPEAPAPA